jgi:hypothetical protein
MAAFLRLSRLFPLLPLLGVLLSVQLVVGQSPTPLLELQRSKADLSLETNVVHAQGMNGVTYGKSGDVSSYPNTLSCLVVYGDGKYVLEKRDELTVGKPKVKTAEGFLAPNDLQQLTAILNDDSLKGAISPKAPNPPESAQIREIETLDAQIERAGTLQRITTVKERLKMVGNENNASNGMDTYLDNGGQLQKTMKPLLKWFDGLEKKSKSDLKDSKPQYCKPINIG